VSVLSSELRKQLEDACVRGRRASESASRSALGSLGVAEQKVPAHLDEGDRVLRRGLRAKSRQLGDADGSVELLVGECAFEQWHRLLFARFLAENGLLIHPDYCAPVTLAECEELAEDLGEPDGWAVAGRFAAQILPGIFRLGDPCVQLRLAPEGRQELERIVAGLPPAVFTADDALGWVYQFWQKEKKDEVNASERKIGGADLAPVTQLFTENYMVRFLLENSLGAWWAARHPDSPLIKEWEYLRFDENGAPAAGSFDGWPDRVADVTVMDPCCGSGHFVVEAFEMLWRMRAEEEGLTPAAAQDGVLRDNLFGLELDPRCVQIAMFAVALAAWKAGGGWRELPVPHIACSGIPVRAPVEEWKALAGGDPQLENALVRLHILFRDADTLGSLIDPKRAVEISDPTALQKSFDDVEWDDIIPLLEHAFTREVSDPATAVLGADAAGLARAADYLSRQYTLVATNVPYLVRGRQSAALQRWGELALDGSQTDLATLMLDRSRQLCGTRCGLAIVSPQNWTTAMPAFEAFRRSFGRLVSFRYLARLGVGAFSSISGEVVQPCLLVGENQPPLRDTKMYFVDMAGRATDQDRDWWANSAFESMNQVQSLSMPGAALTPDVWGDLGSLRDAATAFAGAQSGDDGRYRRSFWELSDLEGWRRYQTSSNSGAPFGGRESILRLSGPSGATNEPGAVIRGTSAWGEAGVAIARVSLNTSLYSGEPFNDSVTVIVPSNPEDLAALWAGIASDGFRDSVRVLSRQVKVGNKIFEKVPFDWPHWRRAASGELPEGLPEPWSDDPTQWLFEGRPDVATEPLQVAVSRLLGYRWPEQPESDDLDALADDDGIVCLPSVLGERTAADRLQELLSRAFAGAWSPARAKQLLKASGSKKKDVEAWLRDDFFKAHCQVFKNRPFVWQIWDGRKDGFSALVNYHRLDRPTLERLTYTYLGDWIERQSAGVRDDVAGAEERLAAARDLQRRLELIVEGEPPYDIYVRWKSLAEQPIGWEPDLNDGVRLNVRPFVEAGVLRSKFNVKWEKDGGKNPDGSERINNLHYTLAEKQAARAGTRP
jgi:hypothetical protein